MSYRGYNFSGNRGNRGNNSRDGHDDRNSRGGYGRSSADQYATAEDIQQVLNPQRPGLYLSPDQLQNIYMSGKADGLAAAAATTTGAAMPAQASFAAAFMPVQSAFTGAPTPVQSIIPSLNVPFTPVVSGAQASTALVPAQTAVAAGSGDLEQRARAILRDCPLVRETISIVAKEHTDALRQEFTGQLQAVETRALGQIRTIASDEADKSALKIVSVIKDDFKPKFQAVDDNFQVINGNIQTLDQKLVPMNQDINSILNRLQHVEQFIGNQAAAGGAGGGLNVGAPAPQPPAPQAPAAGGAGGVFNFGAPPLPAPGQQGGGAVMPQPSQRALAHAQASGIPDAFAGWLMRPHGNGWQVRTGQDLANRTNEIQTSLAQTGTFNGP